MKNILVHGTLDFDRIMHFPGKFQEYIRADELHKLNVSLYIDRVEERFGGGAGAIAYTLRLLGEKPTIISAIGNDGGEYVEHIRKLGLSTEYIEQYTDAKTSTFTVVNDEDHHQFGFFYSGALQRNVPFSAASFQPSETVMILSPRDNNPETAAYAQQCRNAGIRYVFDPGQTIGRYSKADLEQLIGGAYMLTLNEYEMETLKKATRMSEYDLLQLTEHVVMTMGGEGSRIFTRDGAIDIPRCASEQIVDTTSAGDAYRAGVLKGIAAGVSVEHMGRIGSVAAAYVIESYGGQEHTFSLESFRQRYVESYAEKCPI